MGITSLVAPIVREIGYGSQYRKFLMQTVENKTVLRVFDYNGNELINRVKTISTEKLGNKIVRTKNYSKVENRYGMNGGNDILSVGNIVKSQRIYNEEGKLLGGRITEQEGRVLNHSKVEINPLDLIKDGWKKVTKYIGTLSDSDRVTKTSFEDGIRFRKKFTNGYTDIFDFQNALMFNNKGLPIPATFHNSGIAWRASVGSCHQIAYKRANDKSLKEMVKMAREDSLEISKTVNKPWNESYGDPKLAENIFYDTQHLNIV